MSQGTGLIQRGLKSLGYDPGPEDGLFGPRTKVAAEAWIAARGQPRQDGDDLPWMTEARKVMGLHERAQNAELRAFLKADGATLGDPAKLPWCGDFVATCIRLALPNEQFSGQLGENPYWARNWMLFGRDTVPTYGAVMVFARDGGGHVGFCAGEAGSDFAILGGNQSNTVSITRISKARLLGARWPLSYPNKPINLPRVTIGGARSTNEA